MKWISSLDELLFEVTSWLLFFPIVLWRSTFRPIRTMNDAEQELTQPEATQYSAGLSPPLFLAVALLITHGIATALGEADAIVASQRGMAALINDATSALILRLVVFAAFPVFTAARLVRRSGLPLDRETLRSPFYAQCHPTAVLALGLGIGGSLVEMSDRIVVAGGALLMGLSLVNYLIQETRWFAAQLRIGYGRALVAVMLGFAEGATLLILVAWLLAR